VDLYYINQSYLTNYEAKIILAVRWGVWCEPDLNIYPMFCKKCKSTQDTEHVLINGNQFKNSIEQEIRTIVKHQVQLVEHEKIQQNYLQFSMRGTISKALGQKIQDAEYLMILKIVAKYLSYIKHQVPITTQRFRPILPRLSVVPSVVRSQSDNNVEQGILN